MKLTKPLMLYFLFFINNEQFFVGPYKWNCQVLIIGKDNYHTKNKIKIKIKMIS